MDDHIQKKCATYANDDSREMRSFFEDVTVHFIDPEGEFLAGNVWFHRFKACAIFLSCDKVQV
jgi:hypothetical protein